MSITIRKRVRVLDGVTNPPGGSRKIGRSARNGISQIAETWCKNNWLPVVDAFRALAAWGGDEWYCRIENGFKNLRAHRGSLRAPMPHFHAVNSAQICLAGYPQGLNTREEIQRIGLKTCQLVGARNLPLATTVATPHAGTISQQDGRVPTRRSVQQNREITEVGRIRSQRTPGTACSGPRHHAAVLCARLRRFANDTGAARNAPPGRE